MGAPRLAVIYQAAQMIVFDISARRVGTYCFRTRAGQQLWIDRLLLFRCLMFRSFPCRWLPPSLRSCWGLELLTIRRLTRIHGGLGETPRSHLEVLREYTSCSAFREAAWWSPSASDDAYTSCRADRDIVPKCRQTAAPLQCWQVGGFMPLSRYSRFSGVLMASLTWEMVVHFVLCPVHCDRVVVKCGSSHGF
jgi:hypothetical protein